MSEGIIAVDCDLCVVDMATPWMNWLNGVCGEDYTLEDLKDADGMISYNIADYYQGQIPDYIDPMDFWRNAYLYDDMQPFKEAQEVLKKLHAKGYTVRFVSAVTGNHHRSKYYFLTRYFPYRDAVLLTKEKFAVTCDYLIDDRNNFLNAMPEGVQGIKLDTPFKQQEELNCDAVVLKTWREIGEYFNV